MKKTTTVLLVLFFVFSQLRLQAGAFQINTQSPKATSMGGSLTGWALDASANFFNPGAVVFLEKNSFLFGAHALLPRTVYMSPLTGKETHAEGKLFLPLHFYGAYKLKEKLAIGLSVNSPYGTGIKWADDWEGRYIVQEAELKTLFVQPTASYRISEKFSIGLGFVYAHAKATYSKAIDVATTTSSYGKANFDGKANNIGLNAGIMIKFNESLQMGLAYRSKINMSIKGDAQFTNIPSNLSNQIPASADFSSRMRLPSVLSLGIVYQLTKEIKLSFETNITSWNKFDSLNFEFSSQYAELNENGRSGRKYKDAVAVRLGMQYAVHKKLDVRAGVAYDQTPVKNGYVTPDNPDANKYVFAAGITLKATEKIDIDFGYLFETLKERQDTNSETLFKGSYNTIANCIGLGINFKF